MSAAPLHIGKLTEECKTTVTPAMHNLRAWGPLFIQAAKDGHIKRSDMTYRRSMGNGSLAVGWVSA